MGIVSTRSIGIKKSSANGGYTGKIDLTLPHPFEEMTMKNVKLKITEEQKTQLLRVWFQTPGDVGNVYIDYYWALYIMRLIIENEDNEFDVIHDDVMMYLSSPYKATAGHDNWLDHVLGLLIKAGMLDIDLEV